MSQYYLSPQAEQDIDEIVTYLAHENVEAALKLLDSLYESLELLSLNPKMGYKREELTNKPVRFWPFKWHYLVVYKDCSPIEVVRVLSGYRDVSSLLS